MSVSVLNRAEEDFLTSQKRKHRQISRIIRHIRDQIHTENHHIALPNDHTIEELVGQAVSGVSMPEDDWQQTIYQTLQRMVKLNTSTDFQSKERNTIGFSINREPMDVWQIKNFALRALKTIGADLPFNRKA